MTGKKLMTSRARAMHRTGQPRRSAKGMKRAVVGGPPPHKSRYRPTKGMAGARSLSALKDELRKSEERFRLLIETVAAPVVLLSPGLTVLEINEEAARLYGLPRASILGKSYFRALDPRNYGGLGRVDFEEVLAGRPVRGVEGHVQRDNVERVLLWNAAGLTDRGGRCIGVVAVAQDVTERQRAEEALREREARLRSVIATAPDAIITIDEKGTVQSFSIAAERLFGFAAGEVIGRNVNMLMPSPHHENHDGYLARYLRTGEKRIIGIGRQVEARRKDGTIFPMELAVGEVHVGSTRIFTGFIRDISARAKIEQDLRQAQKMEAVGQLSAGLAHDFNNLLTVITGNLEMLARRIERAEDREILSEAVEAAERGAELSNRLLAFGRRQTLDPKPIDLSALVTGMADMIRRSIGEMIRMDLRLAPRPRLTLADPGQFESALLNLAINARDAMREGGTLVIETANVNTDMNEPSVHAKDGLAPGGYVMLAVTDTGIGMVPEVREHAFEPFFTTKGAGSGLGLSMVYGFVKQSGGHIHLESELGHGTTVRIYLPAHEAATASASRDAAGAEPEASRHETVLIVEDDARVRRTSVRRLRELGYRIIEAENGPGALDILERGDHVDILFTDVVMPGGMSGVDLARAARQRRPKLGVLFTSGYAELADIRKAMMTENAVWLAKPYTNSDLAAKLREIVDH